MRCLLDAGHRHIGIIGLPKGMSLAADQRMNGMTTEYQAHGLDADTLTCVNGTFSSDSGMAATRTLLELSPDLTAILALNDRMAMGAVRQLQEMGYHVPDQISVVGYDDLPQSADFNPPLTTINQQLSDWGTLAMDMLVTLLEGKEPEPIVLPPQLVIRKSTAPPNGHT
jgi:LacI family transcriptional regulator